MERSSENGDHRRMCTNVGEQSGQRSYRAVVKDITLVVWEFRIGPRHAVAGIEAYKCYSVTYFRWEGWVSRGKGYGYLPLTPWCECA